jgi:hypothetical protein
LKPRKSHFNSSSGSYDQSTFLSSDGPHLLHFPVAGLKNDFDSTGGNLVFLLTFKFFALNVRFKFKKKL